MAFLLAYTAWAPAAIAAGCREPRGLPLRVRFANEAPRDVLLQSTAPAGLQLLAAASRQPIWSIGPSGGHTQRADQLNASFGSSLAAIHLDADGVHDRVYAGDTAGRLWRFDLQPGAHPEHWMRITLLADLRAPNRGFIAAPDVTLVKTPAGSWLSIAIGTASIGAAQAHNRFYVLHDSAGPAVPATPLTEPDLDPAPDDPVRSGSARGHYLKLGSAQVLAQSLTLEGRTWFTAVESGRPLASGCAAGEVPAESVPLSVTALELDNAAASEGDPGATPQAVRRVLLAGMLPADAGVQLSAGPIPPDGKLSCLVDTTPVPGCSLDTRPRRIWWLREDAD